MKCFWVKKLAHKGCPCLCGGGVGQFKSAPEPEDSVRDSSVRSLCPILCPPPNSTKGYELSHESLESLAGHGICSTPSKLFILRAATATNQKVGSSNLSGHTILDQCSCLFPEHPQPTHLGSNNSLLCPTMRFMPRRRVYTVREGTTLSALRGGSAMGIKFNLDGQGFVGCRWGVSPLFDCLHGGLTKNRTSAQQLCALDNPVGANLNLYSHHSPDVKSFQSFRVFRLDPSDQLSFPCALLLNLSDEGHYTEQHGYHKLT